MPARLSVLKHALESMGADVVRPNSGSHWKAVKDGTTYTIPAHNGERTEITDVYIKGVCRCFGWDVKEFKKLL